jgi:hypothetical protein
MSEPRQLWERMEGEAGNWYARFLAFRDLSVTERGLYRVYVAEAQTSSKKYAKHVPGACVKAADTWHWRKRADAHDMFLWQEQQAKATRLAQLEEEEEARLLSTGYARAARRIEQLSMLYDELKTSYREGGEKDGKIIYQWLTPDKVREMRGCLDDIAKEVGERVKKAEIAGRDGGPIEFVCEWGGSQAEDTPEET